jgi:hypothetical protein
LPGSAIISRSEGGVNGLRCAWGLDIKGVNHKARRLTKDFVGSFRRPRRVAGGHNDFLLQQGFHPCYSKDMAKVTSKLQLTVPKAIADQYGI